MRRIIAALTAVLMLIAVFGACGSGSAQSTAGNAGGTGEEKKNIRIVTTIFPLYDWVRNIIGPDRTDAELTMLLDNGVDLHSFQPSAADIMKISDCDLFIYVGGESDRWVDNALREAVNKDMAVISLLDVLGDAVKEEEIVEGMQDGHHHEHEEGGEHSEEDHEHEEGEHEYDEHVWLSLRNAHSLVQAISAALETADPANADTYRSNTAAYLEQLDALDAQYRDAVDSAAGKTILFGDRFPFRYLADDYGLNYYAAFAGCSAETEASFETVTFLSQKTEELQLSAVLTIDGTDRRIAETIVQNTASKNQKILTMDSMQSVTKKDVENGITYLSVMESNLAVLKEALN